VTIGDDDAEGASDDIRDRASMNRNAIVGVLPCDQHPWQSFGSFESQRDAAQAIAQVARLISVIE
jgi:hypothetical protein